MVAAAEQGLGRLGNFAVGRQQANAGRGQIDCLVGARVGRIRVQTPLPGQLRQAASISILPRGVTVPFRAGGGARGSSAGSLALGSGNVEVG